MVRQAVQFWRRDLDLGCTFWNINYHTQDPYSQWFPSNTNVITTVPTLSFEEPVLDVDHPAGGSDMRLHILPQ